MNNIVIVGGGTAGWITACLLAAAHGRGTASPKSIVLVESPDIPTIGVGEGTWPSMRMTLQAIGLQETDLLRECDASFKQGTEFIAWSGADDTQRYYHPFSLPLEYSSLNLAGYWLALAPDVPFADFVSPQSKVIAAGLAPKQAATPPYAFNVNYGYHFDAGRFAKLLHRHAVETLGVRYVSANVSRIDSHDNGDIAAVVLDTDERLEGDLFVDCSGQRSLLLGQHLGVPFKSVDRYLFNDAAIAVQVPYASSDDPIASVTRATAVDTGWIWDIGLQSRRGIGHVYSTAHADDEHAMANLRRYLEATAPAADPDALAFRKISFQTGHRAAFWERNCVAIGLSAGFVEPLEASAIALIEQAAGILSKNLPVNRELMDVVARRFNDKMHYHWQRIVEFLKLHYVLSRRDDSDYWRDCRDPDRCPEELRQKLRLWEQQPPWHDDAPRVDELFPSASYQYVLYGMGFRPRFPKLAPGGPDAGSIDKLLHAAGDKARQLVAALPPNRDLLNAMTAMRGVA